MTLLSPAHKTDLIVNNLNHYLGRTARKYFKFCPFLMAAVMCTCVIIFIFNHVHIPSFSNRRNQVAIVFFVRSKQSHALSKTSLAPLKGIHQQLSTEVENHQKNSSHLLSAKR